MYLPPDTNLIRDIMASPVRVMNDNSGYGSTILLGDTDKVFLRSSGVRLIRTEAEFIAYAINFYRSAILLNGNI